MSELDDLKILWRTQKTGAGSVEAAEDTLGQRLEKHRKRILRANIFCTIGTMLVSGFLLSIMFAYPGQSLLFYFSLSLVILMMGGVTVILWRRSLLRTSQLAMDSQSYVDYQLKRLRRSKLIIQYSPLYGLILGILMNAYAYSLIMHASTEFVFWMININWVYTFLLSYLSYAWKMRKFRANVEPIIRELEELEESLNKSVG